MPQGLTGAVNVLVALVDFNDNVHTVTPTFFDSLVFAPPVSGRGSVRDYYGEISYGQVDVVTLNLPSGLGWRSAVSNYAYYVNGNYCEGNYPQNCEKLAEEVIDALHLVGVDFSNYDNNHDGFAESVIILHAGPGAEFTGNPNDVWSHSSVLPNPRSYDGVTIRNYIMVPEYWETVSPSTSDMTIGVIAHEMAHSFWDAGDLYDADLSSWGIGSWSLMSSGVWNGPNRMGASPAWPDAWNRVKMGFITPTNVSANIVGKNIPQVYDNPSAQTVFRLRSTTLGSQEYFLLENRQQVSGSYDEYLPGHGLFIWHVDESVNTGNNNECKIEPHYLCPNNHYLVALEQADGQRHLENKGLRDDPGDPFPGASNNRNWTMSTNPESSSWYTSTNSCIKVTNDSDSGATMTVDLQVACFFYYLPHILRTH
jgi:immune inhibitor A